MNVNNLDKMTKTYFFSGTSNILKISGVNNNYTNVIIEISAYTDSTAGFYIFESDFFHEKNINISILGNSLAGRYTSNDIEIYSPLPTNINNEYYLNVKSYNDSSITTLRFVLTLTFF